MKKAANTNEKGFLSRYRVSKPKEVRFIPLATGYLRLEYGLGEDQTALSLVSFVVKESKTALAVGERLEFDWDANGGKGQATFIAENAVSGLQWSGGRVLWGHTYDDDSPPSSGRKIRLEEWVDECVAKMINPERNDED